MREGLNLSQSDKNAFFALVLIALGIGWLALTYNSAGFQTNYFFDSAIYSESKSIFLSISFLVICLAGALLLSIYFFRLGIKDAYDPLTARYTFGRAHTRQEPVRDWAFGIISGHRLFVVLYMVSAVVVLYTIQAWL